MTFRRRSNWRAPICFLIKLLAWGRVSSHTPLSLDRAGHGKVVPRDCSSASAQSLTSPRSITQRPRITRATVRPCLDLIAAKIGKNLPRKFAIWAWPLRSNSTSRKSRPKRLTWMRTVTLRLGAQWSLKSRSKTLLPLLALSNLLRRT